MAAVINQKRKPIRLERLIIRPRRLIRNLSAVGGDEKQLLFSTLITFLCCHLFCQVCITVLEASYPLAYNQDCFIEMSLICKLRIQNVQTFQVIFCFLLYFSEPMADDFLNIRQVMAISAARAA